MIAVGRYAPEDTHVPEAELRNLLVRSKAAGTPGWRDVLFSVGDARRALPYVARVVRDAVEAYQRAQCCRTELLRLSGQARERMSLLRDEALHRLNRAIDECNGVGADLLDLSAGSVRFPGHIDGRVVSLLWRIDEPIAGHWLDLVESDNKSPVKPGPAPVPRPRDTHPGDRGRSETRSA